MSTQLFLYGDAAGGGRLDGLAAGLPRHRARVHGRLYRLPSGAPALLPDPTAPAIEGEVVELPAAALLRPFDLLAGPELRRVRAEAELSGGRRTKVWVHALSPEQARRLPALRARSWAHLAPPGRGGGGGGPSAPPG